MGARKMYEDRIIELVKTLPEKDLPELISMAEHMQEKKKEEMREAIKDDLGKYNESKMSSSEDFTTRKESRNPINEICGKYKDVPTSVDAFMMRKEEEKKLDR